MVQQAGVGRSAAWLDRVTADELVDVLKAGIFAHVHHCAIILGHGHGRALVRAATHRGALHGGGAGVVGVNFHNPAKAVGFVGVLDRVKARVMLMPAVAAAFFHAPALFVLRQAVPTTEVVDEVFFCRQVGAPRSDTAGAVVQGSEDHPARGVRSGLDQSVANHRTAQFGTGIGRDAASPRRGVYHRPFTVFVFYFYDGHAMRCL